MSIRLRHYLLEFYDDGCGNFLQKGNARGASSVTFQIDDQGDDDSFTDFCNIFCIVTSSDSMRLELYGKFPITDDMIALAKSCRGSVDRVRGRLTLDLSADDAQTVLELARMVKATAHMGAVAGNPSWLRISARTVSSLLRFARVLAGRASPCT